MLLVGSGVLIASALAFSAVLLLALVAPFLRQSWWWTELWCLAALAIALRNGLAGIAMMAALDWRPLPMVALLSGAVIEGWLALP